MCACMYIDVFVLEQLNFNFMKLTLSLELLEI